MLSYVIKNVIVYFVIFSGKKNENGDNWYFPSINLYRVTLYKTISSVLTIAMLMVFV